MEKKNFTDLASLVSKLRGTDGCPWDKEQNSESLKKYLIEETYEVLEAIDNKNPAEIKEELGDLLYQVLFHAQIGKENNEFDIYDVITSIHDKMVRRHPHVFGKEQVKDSQEVLKNWEIIKGKEKKGKENNKRSILDGVPKELPSLLRAYRLQSKVSHVGFDFKALGDVQAKLKEELSEFLSALNNENKENITEEFGDILFVLTNISRHLDIDPEDALQKCNNNFTKRFRFIENELEKKGLTFTDVTLDYLESLWNKAKVR